MLWGYTHTHGSSLNATTRSILVYPQDTHLLKRALNPLSSCWHFPHKNPIIKIKIILCNYCVHVIGLVKGISAQSIHMNSWYINQSLFMVSKFCKLHLFISMNITFIKIRYDICNFNTLKDTSMLKIKKLGKFLYTDICPTFATPCIYTY